MKTYSEFRKRAQTESVEEFVGRWRERWNARNKAEADPLITDEEYEKSFLDIQAEWGSEVNDFARANMNEVLAMIPDDWNFKPESGGVTVGKQDLVVAWLQEEVGHKPQIGL